MGHSRMPARTEVADRHRDAGTAWPGRDETVCLADVIGFAASRGEPGRRSYVTGATSGRGESAWAEVARRFKAAWVLPLRERRRPRGPFHSPWISNDTMETRARFRRPFIVPLHTTVGALRQRRR